MIPYKQKCVLCKKENVLMTSRNMFPVCYSCQKEELDKKIKDPKMKKMFDIPEEFYKKSSFLCSIKINYQRYGRLTEKQIEFFKKAVEEMEKESKS